jgi:hypothetical protein
VTSLHQQDVIADYHRIPDGNTRIDLADGRRVYVGDDFNPENPEEEATGYIWTAYTVVDGEEVELATGSDTTIATLGDAIRKLAAA